VNLLLLEPGELAPDGTARLAGRRARHVHAVLRVAAGDSIRAGVVGGRMGEAEVLALSADEVVLAPRLDLDPPPPAPVALLLALPRPKILRRALQAAASMGVKRIVLAGSWRVEKSYFGSPLLAPERLRQELLLGLEQGRDTILPEVQVRRLFKPLVEDELDALLPAPARLLAHPVDAPPLEAIAPPFDRLRASGASGTVEGRGASGAAEGAGARAATLAIGPEGGFTAYEAGLLQERGFRPFTLGARILRVDAAVPYAVGQVELWLRRALA
jgi:RsmE family RNA methyltransferase